MNRRYTPPPRKVSRSANTRLRAASDVTWAIVSNSERPFGSWSAGMRSELGMSTRRPSIESTPIAASISARSSGEWTRYGKLGLGLGELLVRGFVHQVRGQLARQLELEDPTVSVWVRVDELGLACQLVVDCGHAAGHRSVEIAGCFDGFDHTKALAGLELAAWIRKLEKHDVAELRLGEIRDADSDRLALDREPFMRLRVKPARHAIPPSS